MRCREWDQSIWKSLAREQAFARLRSGDAVCLFVSLFGVDDVYVWLCTPYRAQYMLQETRRRCAKFHSDFVCFGAEGEDESAEITLRSREALVLRGAGAGWRWMWRRRCWRCWCA